MHIVLFDLDGTALTFDGAPGPGRAAIDRAMDRVFGVSSSSSGVRFAGGTDRAIARALLRKAGAPEDEATVAELLDAYLQELEAILSERRYRPVGDVASVLAACRARGSIVGIGTGNVRAGAALKLRSAGLLELFDLDRGGYGCDAEARDAILRTAVTRCAQVATAATTVVVVGDTEHDVCAGRAIGARVVGVGTHGGARAELAAAGADAIVDTCGPALVEAIYGGGP